MSSGEGRRCVTCGVLILWANHTFPEAPDDCERCHARDCRSRNCARDRVIDSGWREKGWPR